MPFAPRKIHPHLQYICIYIFLQSLTSILILLQSPTPTRKLPQQAPNMLPSNYAKRTLLLLLISRVGAQSPAPPDAFYANFSPSMAVIIAVLVSALFFMGFFSIYIRHCTDMSSLSPSTAARNLGASLRRRGATRGLDPSLLETFPTFAYSEVKDKKIGKGVLECAVCLNEFAENDRLRLIPRCDHVFHPDCIDAWLASHVTCPVCRADLNEPPEQPEPTEPPNLEQERTGEVSVRITEKPLSRSRSVRAAKVLPKFPRSHSTGHSVLQPGDKTDRFTLRLPEELRNQVMTRALDRTSSCVVRFPIESSSTTGYRSTFGRSLKRFDPIAKSDRWVFSMAPPFLSRGPSMSGKGDGVVADGEGSVSAKTPRGSTMRLPSFKCLEPKGDETCLMSRGSKPPPV